MLTESKANRICCGCKYCSIICPELAITLETHFPELIPEKCTRCKICLYVCPLDCVKEEVFAGEI
jgi:Pyruvate/2-oxoacid:ferredoxin oxidoreductase delta subunit